MHQDRCVELAREAAVHCGERHEYMPATELLAETWHPHRWVVDAMLLATNEAEIERDSYKNGNTELLELLMKLHAGQHESILPRVREILAGAGLLNADPALKPDIAALKRRLAEDPGFAAQVTGDRPPTPVGWSDTDWLKHLEEIRQDQVVYHRGPLPETGGTDDAARPH